MLFCLVTSGYLEYENPFEPSLVADGSKLTAKTKKMKTKILRLITILLLLLPVCVVLLGAGCEKDEESEKQSVNITLHNKKLSIIQNYTTGNWKLQYAYGGLSAHKVVDTHNSYMDLTPEHIIMGNDLYGIV